jgi:hypothetical protein
MEYRMRKCDLALFREVIALGDRLKKMPEDTPLVRGCGSGGGAR